MAPNGPEILFLRGLFFGRPEIGLYNQQRGERFGGLVFYD